MNDLASLVGQRFTRLVVLSEYSKNSARYLSCKCDCGNIIETQRSGVLRGRTKSCGCYRRDKLKGENGIKHHNKKFNEFVFKEDHVEGFTSKGISFVFDKSYYDNFKDIRWTIGADGYVVAIENKKMLRMHRLIIEQECLLDGLYVDHIDGDKTNNRRVNLRVCTNQQNSFNHALHKSNKSGVNGVFWDKKMCKWNAKGKLNYKNVQIGYFDSLEDAADARREWELANFKEYSPFASGREVNSV